MLKPNSFLVTIGANGNNPPKSTHDVSQASLETSDINPFYMRHETQENGDFALFFGERQDGDTVDFNNPISGTSITFSGTTKNLIVRSDLTGAEPVYYRSTESEILLSNRLDNLVIADDDKDWDSIHCYLSFGYTLGESTFFNKIQKTLPNQIIEIDLKTLQITKNVLDSTPESLETGTLEDNGRKFAKLFSDVMFTYKPMALMMSGGWDSRTLLAPSNSPIKVAYTHGDLSSRECTIAKKLSGIVRKDHHFRDVKSMVINKDLLDEMLELHGHCLWPALHLSSKFISDTFNLPIATGVIGARLGGHNGFPSKGSRFQKAFNSLYFISPKIVSEQKIIDDFKNSMVPPSTFWFTSDKGNEIFKRTKFSATKIIHKTIDTYLKDTKDFSFAIEKFNYDHVSRQYMMMQPIMAKPFQGYYSPLSHPDLLRQVCAIPFKQRIHNRLTKRVISELNSELLEFPMAATLVKAKRSIFFQEVSRFARIIFENIFFKLKKIRPSLGWFNYEHLYTGDFFDKTINSLKSDIWSKDKMLKTIATNQKNGIDAGSTMDMVCKIKTIDYHLSISNATKKND